MRIQDSHWLTANFNAEFGRNICFTSNHEHKLHKNTFCEDVEVLCVSITSFVVKICNFDGDLFKYGYYFRNLNLCLILSFFIIYLLIGIFGQLYIFHQNIQNFIKSSYSRKVRKTTGKILNKVPKLRLRWVNFQESRLLPAETVCYRVQTGCNRLKPSVTARYQL